MSSLLKRVIDRIPLPVFWYALGCLSLGLAGWGWSFYHNYLMAPIPTFGSVAYHVKSLQPVLLSHIGSGIGLVSAWILAAFWLFAKLQISGKSGYPAGDKLRRNEISRRSA